MSKEKVYFSGGPLDGQFKEVEDVLDFPKTDKGLELKLTGEATYKRTTAKVDGCAVFVYIKERK